MHHAQLANEQRSVDEFLGELPAKRAWAATIFRRLRGVADVPAGARVLDVGAAGGTFLIACAELGFEATGVEPFAPARENAARVAEKVGVPIRMLAGSADSIPLPDGSCDVVHAASVMEHVRELDASIAEIRRVLRPGGVFWFNSASAMCPRQEEIRGFPMFGWYPDRVKRAIMEWAKDARPELVDYSRTPAVNWFTPSRARALLLHHGFRRVHDRWDLRRPEEGGTAYRAALGLLQRSRSLKTLADMAISGCGFAAI